MLKKLFLSLMLIAGIGIISILLPANQSLSDMTGEDTSNSSCIWRIYLYGPAGTQAKICGPGGTQTCTLGSNGRCIFFNLCNGTYQTCTINGTESVVINNGDASSTPSNGLGCTCSED